jgi:hypothetical protein
MQPFGSTLGLLLLAVPVWAGEQGELLPPVPVLAAGKPLDIEREGHAAPCVGDFFEDGTLALLVGQYNDGRLRIYRNTGTRTQPKFESYRWFEADGKVASVPFG